MLPPSFEAVTDDGARKSGGRQRRGTLGVVFGSPRRQGDLKGGLMFTQSLTSGQDRDKLLLDRIGCLSLGKDMVPKIT
jgi:hypothetical protein